MDVLKGTEIKKIAYFFTSQGYFVGENTKNIFMNKYNIKNCAKKALFFFSSNY